MTEQNPIRVVSLIGGKDIIGRVSVTDELIQIEKPLSIVFQNTPSGYGVAFLPWLPFVKMPEVASVPFHAVMFINDPVDELEAEYARVMSSIELPDQKIILPTKG